MKDEHQVPPHLQQELYKLLDQMKILVTQYAAQIQKVEDMKQNLPAGVSNRDKALVKAEADKLKPSAKDAYLMMMPLTELLSGKLLFARAKAAGVAKEIMQAQMGSYHDSVLAMARIAAQRNKGRHQGNGRGNGRQGQGCGAGKARHRNDGYDPLVKCPKCTGLFKSSNKHKCT